MCPVEFGTEFEFCVELGSGFEFGFVGCESGSPLEMKAAEAELFAPVGCCDWENAAASGGTPGGAFRCDVVVVPFCWAVEGSGGFENAPEPRPDVCSCEPGLAFGEFQAA